MIHNIKVGDRLEITMMRDQKPGRSYVSQVEDIMENDEFLVHMPISYGQLVKLPTDEKYSVLFFTERGMINFDAEIIEHKKENAFNYVVLRVTSEGERMQRREFFRFMDLIPLKFTVADEEKSDGEQISGEPLFDGIVKDIGGGGVRFVTNENLDEKVKMKCVMMLRDRCLIAFGNVLHKQCFPKANYKFQYRVEFVGISAADQEIIIHYIFNEQRKVVHRQRG